MKVIYIKSQRPMWTKEELLRKNRELEEEAAYWSRQCEHLQAQLDAILDIAAGCIVSRPQASKAQQ